jgi:hypothetical protein
MKYFLGEERLNAHGRARSYETIVILVLESGHR